MGATGLGAGLLVALAVGTGPAGFVVSLVVGWTVETWVVNAVFRAYPELQPQMRLRPLY